MQVKKQNNIVVINQDDDVFKDSNFENEHFAFIMKGDKFSISIAAELANKQETREREERGLSDRSIQIVNKWVTLNLIQEWESITGSDGEDLECNDENKSWFYNLYPELFALVSKSYEEQIAPTDAEKAEDEAYDDAMGKQENTLNGISLEAEDLADMNIAEVAEEV